MSEAEREKPEQPDQQTQRTKTGVEIPVPERDEFFQNLEKLAPPAERADDDSAPSTGD